MGRTAGLYKKLIKYSQSDYYPYHMPGHKRAADGAGMKSECKDVQKEDPLAHARSIDITEIDGFDNLHHAEGILKKAQDKAAKAYRVKHSFYLVGGSTVGILTAVSALLPRKGHILIARNCHKSVYHAIYLRGLKVSYLQPEIEPEFGIPMPITPQAVKKALKEEPDIQAVLITSPTYEGLVADIKGIAKVVHAAGLPLIVDEAHGAHFTFSSALPKSSVRYADVVIHSTHKTTRALTQTALLHVCSDRVDVEEIQRYLDVYMTSSPSYVLMASIEEAIKEMTQFGRRMYEVLIRRVTAFKEWAARWKHFQVLEVPGVVQDPCKLLIKCRHSAWSGQKLYDILLQKYHLQMELCQGQHVLAIMTPYDNEIGFLRLITALEELDRLIERDEQRAISIEKDFQKTQEQTVDFTEKMIRIPDKLPEKYISLEEAWQKGVLMPLKECEGLICSEFVYQYPPGVPIMVPGEIWGKEQIAYVESLYEMGYEVLGTQKTDNKIFCRVMDREGKEC